MKKSGLADSPFFHVLPPHNEPESPPPVSHSTPSTEIDVTPLLPATQDGARHQGNQTIRKQPALPASHQLKAGDSMPPRHHDTVTPRDHDTNVERIRAAVKQFGKEAATHRWTAAEKKAVGDIVYAYKGQNMRTSENEIARIAVNFVVDDYQENGENSVLHQVLKALKE